MKTLTRLWMVVCLFTLNAFSLFAQSSFTGTNAPGAFQDFPLSLRPAATNLAIVVPGNSTTFSWLLLKKGATPSDTDYDFIALANGQTNAINLEAPEVTLTNYVLRVRTPTNSLTHAFTVTVATNVAGLRTAALPATKVISAYTDGVLTSNSWQFFRIDAPTNLPGWRAVLYSTNSVAPDLYVQWNRLPATTNFLKRSTNQNPDTLTFTNNEAGPGPYFIGVYLPSATNSVRYTLAVEWADVVTLTWDPGTTHLGTQVYTNQNLTGGDYYLRIVPQNTALGAWRTALNVVSGEANLYLQRGALPTPATATYKSERAGSDGLVLPATAFTAGEEWFILVRANPGSQWNLVSGEPFVTDLGVVAADASSGSGPVAIGAEGLRFFKTTVPVNTVGWRLWLQGLTNSILVKKAAVPLPVSNDLSQNGQMLVVPGYLVGGQLYFVGIPGDPGSVLNLDSRQQAFADIPFIVGTNVTVSGYPYATFRVQVPVDQIAWQVSVVVSNGNPNVAVRRNLVPNESYNDAYSEVPGMVTDSITLVPPTLSDGTFYITVYGTNAYSCTLQSGNPEITQINFVGATVNADTNRVGWRFFELSDISQQLGALGWDLFLTNFTPGTRIALRRNAVPGIWNYRNPSQGTSGAYDFLSTADFLQRPGHQADVWYVGVYNPNAALGNFTLVTRVLTADPMTFDGGTATRTAVPAGKWQFFQIPVPAGELGWDVRLVDVTAGQPQLVVCREALPVSLNWIGFSSPLTSPNWPSGYQWPAASDWTARNLSADGTVNETGRILTMGYGRPLETGTYYVGVLSAAGSTNAMSYTLSSRGIGPGYTIPVQDLDYATGSATNTLAPRDVAVYRVVVSSNTPSWRAKLTPTAGDALVAVAKDYLPNITASMYSSATNAQTAGKKMLKTGNEHFVQLPGAGRTNLFAGTYYVVVASEGLVSATNSTWIGAAPAQYVLQSLGPMPETDLGTLIADDLLYTNQLEGGDSLALHFHNLPDTLGFELSLENRVGNPVIVSRATLDLADPGVASPKGIVGSDLYGNEGGQANFLEASPGFITVSGAAADETIMLKARAAGSSWPDASCTLRIRKLVPAPLAFDGGTAVVVNQTNFYQFFEVDVPTNALGWDARLVNVLAGSPKLIACRDYLALNLPTSWRPGNDPAWPSGGTWIADKDWTQRSYASDGATSEDGRLLAMGMGRPLQPGTYYLGIYNASAPAPMSYTVQSRGIGNGFIIPVTDLPFAGGLVTNLSLPPREAAYYRVVMPSTAASWQVKLTALTGEAMLVLLSNNVPSVLSGRFGSLGKVMQKNGNEHYLWLPASTLNVPPGTNYLAVVSEGVVNTNFTTRIGSGSNSYSLESRGELAIVNLGTVGSTDLTNSAALQGGEVRAYQFTVPPGISSLEALLVNPTGMPVMVLRAGTPLPYPGAASTQFGAGSVGPDDYGNEGGYLLASGSGDANTNRITLVNPTNGLYTLMVKARGSQSSYPDASYTLIVRAVGYTALTFDNGTSAVTNQTVNTWRYFRVDVPTNALGWDLRLINVTSGAPRLVVCRDLLPTSLLTTWGPPAATTNWPSGGQWAAAGDWTRRPYSADGLVIEDGRILAMGMGQPLVPGTYYVGVLNQDPTAACYTLWSQGIGDGLSLPVTEVAFSGGAASDDALLPRQAAYYKVVIASNTPSWKLRLAANEGEAMLLVLKDHVPSVDTGRAGGALDGKVMQKAGNEHYLRLPALSQTNLAAGTYYLAVIGEGVNPASSSRIGTDSSSYGLTSFGGVSVTNLGLVGPQDLLSADSLEGGESRFYQFTVPAGTPVLELRLENTVGNPTLVFLTNSSLPDPGAAVLGVNDVYGNEGGASPTDGTRTLLTLPCPPSGLYTVAVKARVNSSGVAPDADYTLRVRQSPVLDLNFTDEFNTNGLKTVASGLLLDNQRAYFKVVVPDSLDGAPILGWELDLSQLSGLATLRVRKDALPSDTFGYGMPFTANAAVIVPPFLTNGTWYVEVRGSGSTAFTLTSRAVALQRPAWAMPLPGQPTLTPGLTAPDFADTGLDTNGVPLPVDQGIDLEQGRYHFYTVLVPTNNGGLMRVQMDAISGNSDLYMRLNQAPTYSHNTTGGSGTIVDRSLTGSVTEYANWVPLNGKTETSLTPGTWYLAVRAAGTANARYRLRLSTGHVQPLDFYGGSAVNQIVAGGDWRYYHVDVPTAVPSGWQVTFSQQSGDVVLYLRDTVPPGNGVTAGPGDYKDWATDLKNGGPYTSYDLPGTYTFTVPPVRPGTVYYLGFRAKSDSIFSVSSSTSGSTNPPLPDIAFYGGSVTNTIPAYGLVAYRILTPADALRWRHTSIHASSVLVYLENGTMPTRTWSDDWWSTGANSSQDRYLIGYPWLPSQAFYLVATNTSSSPQSFSLTMNGSSITADDDGDGLPDWWEIKYFGSLTQGPNGDYDGDGVSNLNEYLEGTNPADRNSFRPRLTVLATNGVVTVDPAAGSYPMGASVTLTATPNPGYNFVSWGGAATGSTNPLTLLMSTNKTVIPRFRVPADDFDQRIPLVGPFATSSGSSNAGATKEAGEPNHAGNTGGKSLWWTWTAPFSGSVTLTTAGSDFRNMLAVYTGSAVTSLTAVASNLAGPGTNTSQVTFTAVAGTTYAIAVDGYNGASGNVVLNLTMPGVLVLTNPLRQNDGCFHFTILGPAGQVLRIDATTNFTAWTSLATLTNVTGTLEFTDTASTNFVRRFYRVVVPGVAPQALLLAGPGRLGAGQFQFTILSAPGQVLRIETATGLAGWTTLATLTNTNGSMQFTDPAATNFNQRFYRAVTP